MKDQVFQYFLEWKALVEKRLQKRKLEPFVRFPYPTMIHLRVFVSNLALSSRGTCAYASLPNTLRWFTFGFLTCHTSNGILFKALTGVLFFK